MCFFAFGFSCCFSFVLENVGGIVCFCFGSYLHLKFQGFLDWVDWFVGVIHMIAAAAPCMIGNTYIHLYKVFKSEAINYLGILGDISLHNGG